MAHISGECSQGMVSYALVVVLVGPEEVNNRSMDEHRLRWAVVFALRRRIYFAGTRFEELAASGGPTIYFLGTGADRLFEERHKPVISFVGGFFEVLEEGVQILASTTIRPGFSNGIGIL